MDSSVFIELIGWLGAMLNSIDSIPQIIKTYRTKTVIGISPLFLCTWFSGCLLLLIYSLLTICTVPILFSLGLNCLFPFILIVFYCRYK